MPACYLLHFHEQIAPGRHTTQHYIGYAPKRLADRIKVQRKGQGARLVQVAIERGIAFTVVRTWRNGSRQLERQLKNRKKARLLCPVCQGKPIRCKIR